MIRATLTIGLVCFAFVGQAVANPKLDVWLEMMKLTHSCKENVKHRTARDTALNLAERLRPEEDLKWQVLAMDDLLRFDRITAKIDQSE